MSKLVQLLDGRLTLTQHREVLVLAGWLCERLANSNARTAGPAGTRGEREAPSCCDEHLSPP